MGDLTASRSHTFPVHLALLDRERCPPKAEVVSSNLAGSANHFNDLPSAAGLSAADGEALGKHRGRFRGVQLSSGSRPALPRARIWSESVPTSRIPTNKFASMKKLSIARCQLILGTLKTWPGLIRSEIADLILICAVEHGVWKAVP